MWVGMIGGWEGCSGQGLPQLGGRGEVWRGVGGAGDAWLVIIIYCTVEAFASDTLFWAGADRKQLIWPKRGLNKKYFRPNQANNP
jgi:hypothetical protein